MPRTSTPASYASGRETHVVAGYESLHRAGLERFPGTRAARSPRLAEVDGHAEWLRQRGFLQSHHGEIGLDQPLEHQTGLGTVVSFLGVLTFKHLSLLAKPED